MRGYPPCSTAHDGVLCGRVSQCAVLSKAEMGRIKRVQVGRKVSRRGGQKKQTGRTRSTPLHFSPVQYGSRAHSSITILPLPLYKAVSLAVICSEKLPQQGVNEQAGKQAIERRCKTVVSTSSRPVKSGHLILLLFLAHSSPGLPAQAMSLFPMWRRLGDFVQGSTQAYYHTAFTTHFQDAS